MAALRRNRRVLWRRWLSVLVVPAMLQLCANAFSSNAGADRGRILFVVVVLTGALNACLGILLALRARREDQPEIGYLAAFFTAASLLFLVHGISAPGAIYGSNSASDASFFWAVPIAAVCGLPAVMGRHDLRERIDANWRGWITWSLAFVVAVGAFMLIATNVVIGPDIDSLWTWLVAFGGVAACAMFSHRYLELACIARSTEPLLISAGFGCVGASALLWFGGAPYSLAFWVAHLLAVIGPPMAVLGATRISERAALVRPSIEPIVEVDQRLGLDLGLEPIVHRFVSHLKGHDALNRTHVERTTKLAISAAVKLGLDRDIQRDAGLAALLHDVGKLVLPGELLTKSAPLTEAEYAIMQRHADYGADLLLASPVLEAIAPAVRAHHERIDGLGYPLGKQGTQIPIVARIVAACDAFDAMANSRRYRTGLSIEVALETLERNAGSAWDRRVVEVLVRAARFQPPGAMPEMMDAIGRIGCDCIPDPASVLTDAA